MSKRSLEELERDSFLAEAESLAHLMQHPSWPRYEALLTQMRIGALELMANTLNQRKIIRCQGAATVLQELIERPHQIVAAARQITDEEADKRKNVRQALDMVSGAQASLEDDL